jgi:hypothetical protein
MAAVPFGAAINAYNSLIPRYATGTAFHPGGGAIVGENGPEYIDLPRGSKVYTNAQTRAMQGGNNYTLNVNSRDLTTVARMTATFENVRQRGRAK